MDERNVDLRKKNMELKKLQEEFNNMKKIHDENIKDLKEKKRKLIEMIDKKREYTINYVRRNVKNINEFSNLNNFFQKHYDDVDMIYVENVKKLDKQFRNNTDEYESKIKKLKTYIEENYKNENNK